jgi:hypothetical protein
LLWLFCYGCFVMVALLWLFCYGCFVMVVLSNHNKTTITKQP